MFIGQKVKVDVAEKVGEHLWKKGIIVEKGFKNNWVIEFQDFEIAGNNVLSYPEKDVQGNVLIKEDN